MELQSQIDKVEGICRLIEDEKEYLGDLTKYFPELNQTSGFILECVKNAKFPLMINEEFLLQVLKDILYGIEQQDTVFLLDVLRYGLLEIYRYMEKKLQSEEVE